MVLKVKSIRVEVKRMVLKVKNMETEVKSYNKYPLCYKLTC